MTLEGAVLVLSRGLRGHTAQLLSGPRGSGMLQNPDLLTSDQALCLWDGEDRGSW